MKSKKEKILLSVIKSKSPKKIELGAIDDLKKKLDKNISLFDKNVNEVRGMASKFVDLEQEFEKLMNESSLIRNQLSDLAKLSREFIKSLR